MLQKLNDNWRVIASLNDREAADCIRQDRIDIASDPLTYNGDTTTCDVLWRGVPAVTLEGDMMASRRGATILNHTGMRDWIPNERR
ncbi:MAG TPA: hypothetical protein VFW23_16785 [Tepidisphaeraceae bacterium]|nr:hypothetical protein [Tepidisphaeraceae bacterium]